MILDAISARKKVRAGVALQSAYMHAFLKVSYLACLLITIMASTFYYLQAYQSDRTRPGELAALVLGGTIKGETSFLAVFVQLIPIFLILVIWGNFLKYELTFRCRIVLAKCKSMSVWYGSLLLSVLIYAFFLAVTSTAVVFITGTGAREFMTGILHLQNSVDHNVSLSLGLPSTLATSINMLNLFVMLYTRIVCLLMIQMFIWLIAADGKLPLLVTTVIAGVTLLYPKTLWLPIGGTMFFTKLLTDRATWICVLVPLCYITVTALAGWLYVLRTDWMTRFNHR